MAWGLTQSGFSQRPGAARWRACPAAPTASSRSRSSPSSCSAACSKAFRRSCCSGRCCFRSPSAAGVHEVHYAMVVIFAMGIGLFAPPFGVGYYGACAISKVNPDEGIKHIWRLHAGAVRRPADRGRVPVVLDRLPQDLTATRRTRITGACNMSRFFGEIRQPGYVVPDIEAAMDYWSRELGVGPWFYNPQGADRELPLPGRGVRAAQLGGAGQLGPAAGGADPDPQRRAVDVPRLPAGRAYSGCSTSPTGPKSTTPTSRA